MKKKRIFGVLVLFLTLCVFFAPRVQAAYPAAMSAAHPLVGYPLSRARKTIVYTDVERKKLELFGKQSQPPTREGGLSLR